MRETPRLLLAEDNPVNQKLAVMMLGKIGYQVDWVGNGADAIDAVSRTGYAAVLMDLQMPGVTGYEATAEIRRREKGGRRVPIIAMTAAAMEGEREKCLAAGMDDYISKPVKMNELAAVLQKWVRLEEPAIDPARMEELRELTGDDNRDGFLILAETFMKDGRMRLTGIEEALLRDVSEAVLSEAHALKGSSANLGAMRLAALCEDLEKLVLSGDLEGSEELLTHLEAELQQVEAVLRQHL